LYLECASSNSLSQSDITRGTESIVKDDDHLIKLAVTEAEASKRKAPFEASKREEAEKTAVDALKKVCKFLLTCFFSLEVSNFSNSYL